MVSLYRENSHNPKDRQTDRQIDQVPLLFFCNFKECDQYTKENLMASSFELNPLNQVS